MIATASLRNLAVAFAFSIGGFNLLKCFWLCRMGGKPDLYLEFLIKAMFLIIMLEQSYLVFELCINEDVINK
jgi:hypothetical protein